jgi:hypothetical protein
MLRLTAQTTWFGVMSSLLGIAVIQNFVYGFKIHQNTPNFTPKGIFQQIQNAA